ncbi:hypothetical protein [Nonomuraea wenchangensis]|uniref:hypothetical protein n=1 Tax=Nonomuraea wenchangensis TaxID=568860 RepID=UPI00331C4B6A
MSVTFPIDQKLRTLTDNGIAYYEKLNDRDRQSLDQLRLQRARFEAEIETVDVVMRDLEETIARREALMRGDVIRTLTAGESTDPLGGDLPSPSPEGFEPPFGDPRDDLGRAGGHS